MKRTLLSAAAVALCFGAVAKLPPPDDAAKAKAAETAAKAAWQAKVDTYQLCKVQDKIAAAYRKGAAKPAGTASAAAGSAAPSSAAMAAKPASAAVAAAPKTAAPAAAAASAPPTTPVASSAPPNCAEPGPFAYNPPSQTPLETSEAHSPAGNAVGPPSVRPESGQMAPAKK